MKLLKLYIVIFDRKALPEYKKFHKAFVERQGFKTWWHYIQSCYLISTDLSANDISEHFTHCANEAGISNTHLVLRADPSDRQGRLVKDAWAWIKKQTD